VYGGDAAYTRRNNGSATERISHRVHGLSRVEAMRRNNHYAG